MAGLDVRRRRVLAEPQRHRHAHGVHQGPILQNIFATKPMQIMSIYYFMNCTYLYKASFTWSENTNFLHKGTLYGRHLQFDWFGFSCFHVLIQSLGRVFLLVKQEVSCTVILPLRSNWVFSDLMYRFRIRAQWTVEEHLKSSSFSAVQMYSSMYRVNRPLKALSHDGQIPLRHSVEGYIVEN